MVIYRPAPLAFILAEEVSTPSQLKNSALPPLVGGNFPRFATLARIPSLTLAPVQR